MPGKAKLPMGIEDFERIRKDGFYYIDKTGFIRDLLENMAYVNLFTRPRRFGKTLNMSMLKHFFETGSDRTLFDGLEISGEKELCDGYFGKFPAELTKYESAMLAGIPNAPSAYSPYVNLELANQRVAQVLQSMVNHRIITQDEAEQILAGAWKGEVS